MPIALTCPSCGRKLNAPDSAAGRKLKCPKCGSGVEVPIGVEDEHPDTGAKPITKPPHKRSSEGPPRRAAQTARNQDRGDAVQGTPNHRTDGTGHRGKAGRTVLLAGGGLLGVIGILALV